jgi:ABC-type protease/lipase transport system fused ATPase/permease subunit
VKTLEIIDRQRNLVEMVTQKPDVVGCADQTVFIRDGAVKGQERIGG